MKITDTKKETKKTFGELKIGDVFRDGMFVGIKISRHNGNFSDINYVVLADGGCGYIDHDESVELLDAELIIRG